MFEKSTKATESFPIYEDKTLLVNQREREEEMGLRRWLRQFIVKCRESIGWEKDYGGQYDDLDCWAYFSDGSSWHWEGRPWVGSHLIVVYRKEVRLLRITMLIFCII